MHTCYWEQHPALAAWKPVHSCPGPGSASGLHPTCTAWRILCHSSRGAASGMLSADSRICSLALLAPSSPASADAVLLRQQLLPCSSSLAGSCALHACCMASVGRPQRSARSVLYV